MLAGSRCRPELVSDAGMQTAGVWVTTNHHQWLTINEKGLVIVTRLMMFDNGLKMTIALLIDPVTQWCL